MVGCFGKGKENTSLTVQSLNNNENSGEVNNENCAEKSLNDQQQQQSCLKYHPRYQLLSRQPPQQYCCPPPPMPNYCCPNPCIADFSQSVCQNRIPPQAPLPRQTENSRPPPGPPPLNRVMNVSRPFPCRPEPRSIGSGSQGCTESYLPPPPPMPMMQSPQFSQCMPQMQIGMNPMSMMMGQMPMMGMPQCQMPMCPYPWNPMGASFFSGMPMCQIPWNPNGNGQPMSPQPATQPSMTPPPTTPTVTNEAPGTNKVLTESAKIIQSSESVIVPKRERTSRKHRSKKSRHRKKDGKGTSKKSKPSKKRKKKKPRRGKKDMVRPGEDNDGDEEDWEDDESDDDDDDDDDDDSSSSDSDQSQSSPSPKSNDRENCPQRTTSPSNKPTSNKNNNRQIQCDDKSLTSLCPGSPIKVERCVGESLSNLHRRPSSPTCSLENSNLHKSNRHSSGGKVVNHHHSLHKKIHKNNNINQSKIVDCEPKRNEASRNKEQVKGQTSSKCVADMPTTKKHKKGKSYPHPLPRLSDDDDVFLVECHPSNAGHDLRHGGSAHQLRSREREPLQQRDYCPNQLYESQSLQSLEYDQKSPWMKTIECRNRWK